MIILALILLFICILISGLFYKPSFKDGEEYDESEEFSGVIDFRREREEKARKKFDDESG